MIQNVWLLALIVSLAISVAIPPTLFLHLFGENKDGNFTSAEKRLKRAILIIVNRVIWDE